MTLEQHAAESLRALGSDLYQIAERLGAVVFDHEGVAPGTYELLQRAESTTIYVHPAAGARVVACAVVDVALKAWATTQMICAVARRLGRERCTTQRSQTPGGVVELDVQRVALRLLGLLDAEAA